jgi:diguanylate cyclase (GGDEF)-like protein
MQMSEKFSFNNPNYKGLEADINIEPKEGETGLHVVDASNRIYKSIHKRINDAEEAAKEAMENSLVDTLTGCYNRNYYEKYKTDNFDPSRDHLKIGLVFADLNNLKVVNDTMGHDFGDLLLKQAANTLINKFRKNDVAVRLGGDEFVVICHNENNDIDFEHNLNHRLEKTEEDSQNKDVDFAFGTAVYDLAQDMDLDSTLKRADQRMYNNKEQQKQQSIG